MKLSWLFLLGSMALFSAGLVEADDDDDDDRRKYRDKHRQVYHDHYYRHDRYRDRHHHYGHRHHKKRHHKKHHHRDRSDYFWGGVVLGSLGAHAFHHNRDYCPDRRYHDRHHRRRTHYWSNRYGECFKVKYRHGERYVREVPRYKCYR